MSGHVVGQPDHVGGFGAGCRFQLIEGDDRAVADLHDLAFDAETCSTPSSARAFAHSASSSGPLVSPCRAGASRRSREGSTKPPSSEPSASVACRFVFCLPRAASFFGFSPGRSKTGATGAVGTGEKPVVSVSRSLPFGSRRSTTGLPSRVVVLRSSVCRQPRPSRDSARPAGGRRRGPSRPPAGRHPARRRARGPGETALQAEPRAGPETRDRAAGEGEPPARLAPCTTARSLPRGRPRRPRRRARG